MLFQNLNESANFDLLDSPLVFDLTSPSSTVNPSDLSSPHIDGTNDLDVRGSDSETLADSTSEPVLKTVDSMWFDTATYIILEAQGCLFRVPPYLLIAKSEIFRDAYYKSEASSNHVVKYAYNGADPKILSGIGPDSIIFKMMDVTAEEASLFLCALLDPEYFEPPPSKENLTMSILGTFKLASKYQVKFLKRRALAHLEKAYPCGEIDEWDKREDLSTFSVQRNEYHTKISDTLLGTLKVIHLCITYDTLWILPAAYYECCLYSIQTILHHFNSPETDFLSSTIQNTIIHGHIAHKAETNRVLTFLHADLSCPTKSRRCIDIRRDELRKTYTNRDHERDQQDFLGSVWESSDWDEFGLHGMCETCLGYCRTLHKEFRKLAWENLPTLYRLPSWDELRQQRLALMKF